MKGTEVKEMYKSTSNSVAKLMDKSCDDVEVRLDQSVKLGKGTVFDTLIAITGGNGKFKDAEDATKEQTRSWLNAVYANGNMISLGGMCRVMPKDKPQSNWNGTDADWKKVYDEYEKARKDAKAKLFSPKSVRQILGMPSTALNNLEIAMDFEITDGTRTFRYYVIKTK